MPRSPKGIRQVREQALSTLLGEEEYNRSRSLAERRAWELIDERGWSFNDPPDTDEQLLAALTLVDLVRQQVDDTEARLLEALRRDTDPVPWDKIANALGMTRQGAERRFLRATTGGARDAERGREQLARRRQARKEERRRLLARWGRADAATRDWCLRLRVRSGGEEIEGRIDGYAEEVPRLLNLTLEGGRAWPSSLALVEVVAVIAETTPWEDVDPPADPLAGLKDT